MHGTQGQFFIHDKWEIAYRHLGNQICTPHALLTIANMLNCLGKVDKTIAVTDVIANFINQRNTVENLHLQHTSIGTLVAGKAMHLSDQQIKNIEGFHQGLVDGHVPFDHAWSIDGFQMLGTQCPIPKDSRHDWGVSPTLPFVPFEKLQICVSGEILEAWVHSEVPRDMLLKVWKGAFVYLQDCPEAQTSNVLVPNDAEPEDEVTNHGLVLAVFQRELYIAKPSPEVLQWLNEIGKGKVEDVYGHIANVTPNREIVTCGFALSKHGPSRFSFAKYIHALNQCQISVQSKAMTGQVQMFVQGSAAAQQTIIGFWSQILSPEDLANMNIQLNVEMRGQPACLTWTAAPKCPIPIHAMKHMLMTRAFSRALDLLQDGLGCRTRIKIFASVVWVGKLPLNLTTSTLKQCLHAVSWILVDECQFRVICQGRQPDQNLHFHELHIAKQEKPLTFHFVLQMKGGGYNGTKQGHKTQVKNAFAAAMLDEGHDLTWTSKAVEQVMTAIGMKELSKIFHTDHANRFRFACGFLVQCGIDIPKINPSKTSQAAYAIKKKRMEVMPNPENYRAVEGVLVNENGQHTAHTPKFGGHLNGYHMCTSHDAAPWLRQGEVLSKDELALIIFGEVPVQTQLAYEQVTIPCTDEQGRNVLVACFLVLCGEKKVKLQTGDGHKIDTDGTILTAITWRKEDWPEQWQEICQNPYKALRAFPGANELLVSVWGKSYRNKKATATANSADSVQVHCLLREDNFSTFLKLSGFNKLWLAPKSKEGKPHQAWKVIWLDPTTDLQAATVLATKIPDSAGLVCQNARLALRVPKASYEQAWTKLFPNVPVPADIETSRIFKIESLPFGVTNKMLNEWAAHNAWKLRPLRAVGPRSWLVGTGDNPPAGTLHFNGAPLLVRELHGRHQSWHNPIVAGPKPTQSRVQQPSNYVNGFFQQDPWASWNGTKPSNNQNAVPSVPAQPAVVGPTEKQFSQQADRLSKLEEAVKQIQVGASQQAEAFDKLQLENKRRDADNKAHLEGRLRAIKKELDGSLAAALQQQASQFSANFDEIKNLLRAKPKRKTQAGGEDADMSDS